MFCLDYAALCCRILKPASLHRCYIYDIAGLRRFVTVASAQQSIRATRTGGLAKEVGNGEVRLKARTCELAHTPGSGHRLSFDCSSVTGWCNRPLRAEPHAHSHASNPGRRGDVFSARSCGARAALRKDGVSRARVIREGFSPFFTPIPRRRPEISRTVTPTATTSVARSGAH